MINLHKLLDFFSSFTVVPIDPDDVVAQLRAYGIKDEIYFVTVDVDTRIVRGALHHHTYSTAVYGDPKTCADVLIGKDQTGSWRRLVAVKELLHLLDHTKSQTATREECERLIANLSKINGGHREFDPSAAQAWIDQATIYYAIAILFPDAVRSVVIEDYEAGRISDVQISDLVDLPIEVVQLVLSAKWLELTVSLRGQS